MGSNFWLMVNPFRKSLVIGISEPNRLGLTTPIGIDPDPKDDRIPIGPQDCVSMHRHRAGIAQAPLPINRQPLLNAINVFLAGVFKAAIRQVGGLVAQGHVFISLLVHGGIVSRFIGGVYSYFPSIEFVHGVTVSRVDTYKNVQGVQA